MPKERDYAKEWQREKAHRAKTEARVSIKITPELADAFAKKCALNSTTRNAVLKSYIERYVYQDFDQPSE